MPIPFGFDEKCGLTLSNMPKIRKQNGKVCGSLVCARASYADALAFKDSLTMFTESWHYAELQSQLPFPYRCLWQQPGSYYQGTLLAAGLKISIAQAKVEYQVNIGDALELAVAARG